MTLHLSDVTLYDHYCDDPTADNCVEFADGALPVYLSKDDEGDPVLIPSPGRLGRPYGLLHMLYDADAGHRPVVVRR